MNRGISRCTVLLVRQVNVGVGDISGVSCCEFVAYAWKSNALSCAPTTTMTTNYITGPGCIDLSVERRATAEVVYYGQCNRKRDSAARCSALIIKLVRETTGISSRSWLPYARSMLIKSVAPTGDVYRSEAVYASQYSPGRWVRREKYHGTRVAVEKVTRRALGYLIVTSTCLPFAVSLQN